MTTLEFIQKYQSDHKDWSMSECMNAWAKYHCEQQVKAIEKAKNDQVTETNKLFGIERPTDTDYIAIGFLSGVLKRVENYALTQIK